MPNTATLASRYQLQRSQITDADASIYSICLLPRPDLYPPRRRNVCYRHTSSLLPFLPPDDAESGRWLARYKEIISENDATG